MIFFRAQYLGGFVVRANTFDNVKGQFPIAFTMWNLANKQPITNIVCNVIENNGEMNGRKKFFAYNAGTKFLNDWQHLWRKPGNKIGSLGYVGHDFQNQNYVFMSVNGRGHHETSVNNTNVTEAAIYFAVRHAIPATWLNDRDQFLYPTMHVVDGAENLLDAKQEFLYDADDDFKNNCLLFTLFHNQNRISSNDGTNHWIPFSETQVGCQSAFSSDFMFKFLSGRGIPECLSPSALAVYNSGLAIWRYYHSQGANPNASLYDIKELFKGRKDNGKMKNKSDDAEFNALTAKLTSDLRALADEIEPKIYEYGFLRK